jgi:hypothetical protein
MSKKVVFAIFIFCFGTMLHAQTGNSFESFKSRILIEQSIYFSNVTLIQNDIPELYATASYISKSSAQKRIIMKQVAQYWPTSVIIVNAGVKKEMWKKADKGNAAVLIDEWTTDLSNPLKAAKQYNRFYFSLGYQNAMSGGESVNKYGYFRFGGFLILNRVDLSSSLSFMAIPVTAAKNDLSTNISLMGRVHFPIKKYNLSPNVGFEMFVGGNDYSQYALNLGVSWFVGFGSIDLGFRISEISSLMGGVTLSPKLTK